nr:uncharacterized mitochondrial protein AtMg00810-like [Tanacetum cinerariifolium]
MDSAVICLSKGQKFNFSKYIFDSLVRNVDSSSKFYMYPRFIQLIIQNQVGDLSTHITRFISPALTQKVFANMRRVGKGFSGVETPLFKGMLAVGQPAAEGLVAEQVQVDDAAVEENVAEDVFHDAIPSSLPHDIPSPSQEPSSPPHQQQKTDNAAQKLEIIQLKARVKKLEKANKLKSSKLRRLRKDAEVAESQGRHAEKQAEIYNLDLDHSSKVLSMQEEINKDYEKFSKDIDWDAAMDHKATKRRKLSEEAQEAEDLRKRLEVLEDEDDDVFVDATPLAQKVPVVDYQIVLIDNKPKFKIIRADETHQFYISFATLLKNFDREDLETLWRIVKDRFSTSKPTNFSDEYLLLTLRTMFEEPDRQDAIWRNQKSVHGLALVKRWKLLASCGVHVITLSIVQLFLLVERRYVYLDTYHPLKEEVYVAQPDGFVDLDHPKKVYRLRKLLYGFKQAPRAWYDKLLNFSISKGLLKTIHSASSMIFCTISSKTDLRGTINMRLWYPKDSSFKLTAFSNVEHVGCLDTRKSTYVGIQFLGNKLVSWMSKKQDYTTMSSAEAEYVALSASCAQVMWMRT